MFDNPEKQKYNNMALTYYIMYLLLNLPLNATNTNELLSSCALISVCL